MIYHLKNKDNHGKPGQNAAPRLALVDTQFYGSPWSGCSFFTTGLDITTGFNQRKPPHRTVCVAVDLTAEIDIVNHNVLLSMIVRSTLPKTIYQWLSNYLRGRQSVTSCRGVKSTARIFHTGVPQGSKTSPTLFSIYLADMPRPTEPYGPQESRFRNWSIRSIAN